MTDPCPHNLLADTLVTAMSIDYLQNYTKLAQGQLSCVQLCAFLW